MSAVALEPGLPVRPAWAAARRQDRPGSGLSEDADTVGKDTLTLGNAHVQRGILSGPSANVQTSGAYWEMKLATGVRGPMGGDAGLRESGCARTGNYKRESTLFSGAEVR